MISEELLCKKLKLHFIGIGGISMSGLAKYFFSLGYNVSGSDIGISEETKELENLGIKIFYEHKAENIAGTEIIVFNSAISEDNVELKAAKNEGKFILSRSALLSFVCRQFKKSIAVCGSHGKTTATAMITHILLQSDKKITSHIGGIDLKLSNFYSEGKDIFITEACEYKKNFLNLSPTLTVLLNIDSDHLECFNGEQDLIDTFALFCNRSRLSFVNGDDKNSNLIKNKISFGFNNKCDYQAVKINSNKERYSFTVMEYGKKLSKFSINVYGRHNIYNALAAISIGRYFCLDCKKIQYGLNSFCGIKRRYELIGKINGADIYCDYAHHPKEIESSLKVAAKICNKNLYVIFQPHTYTRTINLFDDFIKVLSDCKNLCVYKTYAARENYMEAGSAKILSDNIITSSYFDDSQQLLQYLQLKLDKGDMALFLGAGDIYHIAKSFIELKSK